MKQLLHYSFAGLLFTTLVASAQTVTVTSYTPARNGNAVARTAPVKVELSEPVGMGSSLYVHSAQRGGKLAGTNTSSGRILTFTPAQAFQPGEALAVTVPTSVKGASGTPLAQSQVYCFTTAVTPSAGTFDGTSSVLVGGTATGVQPSGVALADVDGDGDQDMLVANFTYNPGTVSVRLNNGTGTFGSGSEVLVGNFRGSVLMADVDNDGDLDLLNGPNVRLNAGNGTFGNGSNLATSSDGSLTTADVDGDGYLDLLLCDNSTATTSIFRNSGTGQFGTALQVSGGGALAVGDLDGDGVPDLLTNDPASFTWQLLVRRGTGSGTFSSTTTAVPMGVNSAAATRLNLSDIDGDGDLDIVFSGSDGVYTMRNSGALVFGAKVLLPGSALTNGYNNLVRLADIEGDGDLDVISVGNNTVWVSRNDGTGLFANKVEAATEVSLQNLAMADLDGDGDLDLVTTGGVSPRARVWLNMNTATPLLVTATAPARNATHAAQASPVSILFDRTLSAVPVTTKALRIARTQRGTTAPAAVVVGNELRLTTPSGFAPGEKVLVSLRRGVSGSAALLQTSQVFEFRAAAGAGPGIFARSATLPAGTYTYTAAAIPADLDGDGDLDMCSLGTGQYGQVNIALNTGNGTFGPTQYLTIGQYPSDLEVTDMDGDGDLDLLVSSGYGYTSSPGKFSVFTNNGQGSFGAGAVVAVSSQHTFGIVAGDLDGDGDQDVVVLSNATTVSVFIAESDGTFTEIVGTALAISGLTLGPHTIDATLADVDGDGDLDLLASSAQGVSLNLNNGNGRFATASLLPTAARGGLAMADVDADGDLDMLTNTGSQLTVLTNNGQGAFVLASTQALAGGNLVVGDIDGDGDLDVLSGSSVGSGVISVRLNDGLGTFSGSYGFQAAASAQSTLPVALADLDGDGDLDLAAVHYPNPGIEICLNTTGTVTAALAGATASWLTLVPNPGRQAMLAGAAPNQPVRVFDAVGRVVLATTTTVAGTSQLLLPAGLAAGVYVVRVGEQALRLAVE